MKLKIKQSLLALVALPALALSVATVAVPASVFAACDAAGGIKGSADCSKGDNTPAEITGEDGIFKTVANVLLFIIGAIAVIMLIIGGIRYTVSQGDSAAVQSAKNTILYAIIGIIVAILAYAVVNFVIVSFSTEA